MPFFFIHGTPPASVAIPLRNRVQRDRSKMARAATWSPRHTSRTRKVTLYMSAHFFEGQGGRVCIIPVPHALDAGKTSALAERAR